jgi:hypothetical protein
MEAQDERIAEWLLTNGGPIIRYRTAPELLADRGDIARTQLRRDLLACPEVKRWLTNLGQGPIHHSCDTSAENALGKLVEYGLHAGGSSAGGPPAGGADLDEKLQPFFARYGDFDDALVLTPFLVRAGYSRHPVVAEWFTRRMAALHRTAQRGTFAFYLNEVEAAKVPKAWRGKPIYRHEFNPAGADVPLPTCFDFYALAYWPKDDPATNRMVEDVVRFISDPAFQATVGGYIWDRAKRQCYAAGRTVLACTAPERLVMFLELGASFAAALAASWFRAGLAQLERHRTPQGTYRFPADLLKETPNSYYLYAGAHMGLGENRKRALALEIESTFRMMKIRSLMQQAPN